MFGFIGQSDEIRRCFESSRVALYYSNYYRRRESPLLFFYYSCNNLLLSIGANRHEYYMVCRPPWTYP